MIIGLVLTWLVILAGSWLGWQLLRQNGRLLLRLEELEKRLDAVEFGEDDPPTGLAVSTEAPSFELPDLAGERKSLAHYRGQPVVLLFFNPACGFCRELVPKLAALSPSPTQEERRPIGPATPILIISTGGAEANRELFNQHQLGCPVLLQMEMEVAAAYKANGTPSGYLIDAEGKIASELAIGAEALLALLTDKSKFANREYQIAENGHESADRFRNRSLAKSKIKRDGLKAGTPAPDFRLPRLGGRGELSLSDLRGRRVLLVFSSPQCGPCNTLAPELEKFHRANRGRQQTVNPLSSDQAGPANGGEGREEETSTVQVIMISKGEPKENRTKVKEHSLTFPIVLQHQWEISRRYAMFATPIAYLIDKSGIIADDVAVGLDAIQSLLAKCRNGEAMSPATFSQVT